MNGVSLAALRAAVLFMLNIEVESGSDSRLTPTLGLMFYQDTQGNAHTYKIPVHKVGENEYALGAPIQGSAADLQLLRACLDGGLTLHHEHVLACSSGMMLWWVPAERRALHFDSRVKEAAGIAKLNGRPVPQPPLLMMIQGRTLKVFALRENVRPTLTTVLYKAPYWNMFEHGNMCTGTVRLPELIDPQHPEDVTKHFFLSNFSGASRPQFSNHPASHEQMWDDADRAGTFNPEWLVPEQKIVTVGELMTCTTH